MEQFTEHVHNDKFDIGIEHTNYLPADNVRRNNTTFVENGYHQCANSPSLDRMLGVNSGSSDARPLSDDALSIKLQQMPLYQGSMVEEVQHDIN